VPGVDGRRSARPRPAPLANPDPTRPVGAFFVLTSPVEVSFDMVTSFLIPTTGQPVRLRASGSVQVRCADPGC